VPTPAARQPLAGLVGIIINGLFADDQQLRLFLVRHGLEQLGHGQRLQFGIGFHQNGTVSAHGQSGAQGFLALLHAHGNHNDFGGLAGFLQTYGFFHRNFVKGVHRHLDVGDIDIRPVSLHPNLHVVIDNAFNSD